ncbi:related to Symplekin [Armillaria ostoyae]|uniref:Related to Symplekin n=1 Tax=Armillaria ostoyae TaxID=47428 RepID=A0A284R488_ARMOS|nr:related to Symplekin [Armillaria ostoyae]
MSGTPVDPLQTLQAALTVPANSKEQADLLAALRESLEAHPAPIRILVGTLIGIVANTGDSLLKRWVLDLLQFAICRSTLPLDQKTQLASQALDTLAQLLDDRTPAIVKVVIQCLTTVYPLLFRFLCSNRSNPAAWDTLSTCKTRILEFVWNPHANSGVKVSAVKFMQKVILVQTRGISDPRLQNKNDPNISFCPPDHPFISVPKLESEGQKLLENVITILFSSQNVDILSAVLNSWASLTKLRPAMTPVVIGTLKQWTPAALGGLSASSVKSVEKAIRILLIHISRHPNNAQYGAQINEIISQQAVRMERAVIEEKKRKAAQASGIDTKKRSLPDGEGLTDPKRVKLDSEPGPSSSSTNVLSTFDFTTLPATLITDLIVANIEAFTETTLINLVDEYRQRRGLPGPQAPEPPTSRLIPPSSVLQSNGPEEGRRSPPYQSVPDLQKPPPVVRVKDEEPVDPLQMDIDQDEIEYEPDRLNEELSGPLSVTDASANLPASITTNLTLLDFKLPPPREFSDSERTSLVTDSIQRIWTGAEEIRASFVDAGVSPDTQIVSARGATDMTMLLLVRMITRVAKPPVEVDEDGDEQMKEKESENEDAIDAYYERQDQMRQALCEYIMSDFPSRIRLATTWMNEEWYNDRIRSAHDPTWRLNYETWLNQIVASYQTVLDGKDRTFSRFLLDLPSIPSDVLVLLRDLCVDPDSPDRMQVGFTTLRGFVIQRPAMRSDALNVLLDLTTHPEKKIRGAAINTVKLWVPNSQPMDAMVREFALQMLRKLQISPKEVSKEPKKISVDGDSSEMQVDGGTRAETKGPEDDENMEDGQLPPEDLVQTPYLPERIELPAQKSHVLQHVELLFALSVKVPEFLEEIFAAYGQMDVTVQEAVQELITALIRSLGSNHGKLLTLMRNCPPGAETLALRVLTIFTENGRPGAQLVALVKALINERDLDARFLIPIIAEMDKPDIIRHLPRIVSILNGEPEPKNLVRSVFSSVVTTPPQTFGSVTSNLPRVRQSELLTPAELMVLLHEAEKEIGLKSAIEAIGICFSMTDVFRSEILAVVMQQIMDEPVLPVLFLRTVIQAVTTYKSLVGFVSTTLLSRLITKKIWTNPPLWEGFIRCAKAIAPASFGALLQLPKDQLRELVDKQPTLKSGLRDYVMKKATNKTRVSGFLDIFGEAEENTNSPNSS